MHTSKKNQIFAVSLIFYYKIVVLISSLLFIMWEEARVGSVTVAVGLSDW